MTDIAYTVGDTAITVSYQGAQGPGVASGGTAGQFLVKSDSDNYSTEWTTLSESDITNLGVYPDATGQASDKIAQTDGADGWTFVDSPAASTVTSVNSQTGAVVLSYSDVSAAAESHTHTESEITDLGSYETAGVAATLIAAHHASSSTDHDDRYYTEAEVDSALSGKADTSHSHTLSDVTDSGGAAALEVGTTTGTVAAGDHNHTGVYAAASHSHTLSDITDAGTAAASDTGDFATSAQGTLADSAVQPGDDADTLGSGAATDGQVLTADGAGNAAWEAVPSAPVTSVNGETGVVVLSNSDVGAAATSHTHSESDITDLGSYATEGLLTDFTTNAQTGTTYTLVLADAGKRVTLTNASAVTLTVPPNSSVAFPTGTRIAIAQRGAGQVTVAEGSGVTVNTPETLKLAAQYAYAELVKHDTDEWDLVGYLESA